MFICSMRKECNFIFFAHGYPVFPGPFVKKTMLPQCFGLGTLISNQFPRNVWVYLRALNSIPLISVYSVPGQHCLDICSSVVSFETRKCELSNIFLLYQIILANFGTWDFHMYLSLDLANIWEKSGTRSLGSSAVSTILSLPVHVRGMSSHSLRSSLISFKQCFALFRVQLFHFFCQIYAQVLFRCIGAPRHANWQLYASL